MCLPPRLGSTAARRSARDVLEAQPMTVTKTLSVVSTTSKVSSAIEEEYTVVKKLGSGKFGQVQEIKQKTGAKKRFAWKQTSSEKDPYCEQEALLLKELQHEGIVQLMEAYSEGGVVDMVMELCKGNLQEFIADNVARLPNYHRVYIPPEATTIAMVMQKLLETVLFLHEKRVAHRDIKPENVLKSSSGRWKLADFNLATSFEPKRFMRDNVGTLPFQAPEVPQRKYTEKCDIHSMGVLFINLVTGKHYWRPEHTQNQEDIEAGKELMSEKTWKGNKLGTDALDFAKQMVAPENERYSAEEALGNPWLVKQNAAMHGCCAIS